MSAPLGTAMLAYARSRLLEQKIGIAFQEHGEINVNTVVLGLTLPEEGYRSQECVVEIFMVSALKAQLAPANANAAYCFLSL